MSGAGPGRGGGVSKFANRNLNAQLGQPGALAAGRGPVRKTGGTGTARGNLLFIRDDVKRVAKPIGAAAAPAPVALNTPSIKKENNGKDVSINLVPVGVSSVWGQSESKPEDASEAQQQPSQPQPPQQPAQPSVAPWAKGGAAEGGSKPAGRNWVDLNDDDDDIVPSGGGGGVTGPPGQQQHAVYHQQQQQQAQSSADDNMRWGGDARRGGPLLRGSGDARQSGGLGAYGREQQVPTYGNRGGHDDSDMGRGDMPMRSHASAPMPVQGSAAAGGGGGDDGQLSEKQIIEKAHAERQLILQRKRRQEEEERMQALRLEREELEREMRERQRELREREQRAREQHELNGGYEGENLDYRGRDGGRDSDYRDDYRSSGPPLVSNKRPEEPAWGRGSSLQGAPSRDLSGGGGERYGSGTAPNDGRDRGERDYAQSQGRDRESGYDQSAPRRGPPGEGPSGHRGGEWGAGGGGRESYGPPAKVYSLAEAEGPRVLSSETKRRELYDPVAGKLVEVTEKGPERGVRGSRPARAERGRRASNDEEEEDDGRNVPARPKLTIAPAALLTRPKSEPKAEEKKTVVIEKSAEKPKSAWEVKQPVAPTSFAGLAEAELAEKEREKEKEKEKGKENNGRGKGSRREDRPMSEEKIARQQEARNRGPRTKGFLFAYDPETKELIQVLNGAPDEAVLQVPPAEGLIGGFGGLLGKGKASAAAQDKKKGDKKAVDDGGDKKAKGRKERAGSKGKEPTAEQLLTNMRSLGLSENLHLPNLPSADPLASAISSSPLFDLGLGSGLSSGLTSGLGGGLGSGLGSGLGVNSLDTNLGQFLQNAGQYGGAAQFLQGGMGMGISDWSLQGTDQDIYGAASCLGDDASPSS